MNRKVIIATPAHNETVHVGFMDSLIQTIRMSIDKKIDIYPIQVCGDALVQRARNDLIAMAIETASASVLATIRVASVAIAIGILNGIANAVARVSPRAGNT